MPKNDMWQKVKSEESEKWLKIKIYMWIKVTSDKQLKRTISDKKWQWTWCTNWQVVETDDKWQVVKSNKSQKVTSEKMKQVQKIWVTLNEKLQKETTAKGDNLWKVKKITSDKKWQGTENLKQNKSIREK